MKKTSKILCISLLFALSSSLNAQINNWYYSYYLGGGPYWTGNWNTTVGASALINLTSGNGNSAFGALALYSQVTGSDCSAFGNEALGNSTGWPNDAFGDSCLVNNTTGADNAAFGFWSMVSNTTGSTNAAFGYRTLASNTTGSSNAAFGQNALSGNSTGSNNIAIGANTLKSYNGSQSTAVGVDALPVATAGPNTALGYQTLLANTTGQNNDAIGWQALYANTTGSSNEAVGDQSLYYNTTGSGNVAVGAFSAYQNSTGSNNTAVGTDALLLNSSGSHISAFGNYAAEATTAGPNDAFGAYSLASNTSGVNNVALGYQALYSNNTSYNTAIGWDASYYNTSGESNVSIGAKALYNNTTGGSNAAVGFYALGATTSSTGYNTAIGYEAGSSNISGYYNTYVGGNAGYLSGSALNNYTALGLTSGTGTATSNEIDLGNTSITEIRAEVTSITAYSDARVKDNVTENVPGIEFIKRLRPVTYNLNVHRENQILMGKADSFDWPGKYDIEKRKQSGFIAQEVESAAAATNYDFSGLHKPNSAGDLYGLRYAEFVVPLVKAAQEQQQIIENQANTIQTLNTTLNSALAKLELLSTQVQDVKDCCYSGGNNLNNNTGTGSEQLSEPQLLNTRPNPASNQTTIYYYVPQTSQSAQIQLSDGNGVVLQTISVTAFGYSSTNVQLNNLAGGIYYYSLIVNGKIASTKKLSVTDK